METIKQQEFLSWESALEMIQRLQSQGKHRMALLIGCECYLGVQLKHLLQLTWNDLIRKRQAVFLDYNRPLPVDLRICDQLFEIAWNCYQKMDITDDTELCFIKENGDTISASDIQSELKTIHKNETPYLRELSLATLRKTYGRRVILNFGNNNDMALITLSHCFNHRNVKMTKRFLGL